MLCDRSFRLFVEGVFSADAAIFDRKVRFIDCCNLAREFPLDCLQLVTMRSALRLGSTKRTE